MSDIYSEYNSSLSREAHEAEIETLKTQLETVQKALNGARDFIAEIAWNTSVAANASYHAREYLAQIGTGRTRPICLACIKAGEHHAKWCAGAQESK